MPVEYLTPAIEDRAVEILTRLADQGKHRAPSIPDLIIAATAGLAGLTVLHLEEDFDLIAEITGQPMERLNIRPPDCPDRSHASDRPASLSMTATSPSWPSVSHPCRPVPAAIARSRRVPTPRPPRVSWKRPELALVLRQPYHSSSSTTVIVRWTWGAAV